jgi:PAS domain-containing protein
MPAKTQTQAQDPTLAQATRQVQGLFETSGQAMYLFLDDGNKSCNARFAKLLGYADPKAWAAVTTPFTQAFVDPASQHDLVHAFQEAMQDGVGAQVPVTWRRKDGKTVRTQVILVPFEVGGERLALHFIDEA